MSKRIEETIQNVITLLNFKASYYEKNKQFPDIVETKKATGLTSQFINKVENSHFDWEDYRKYYSAMCHEVFHALYIKAKSGDIQAIKLFLDYNIKEIQENNNIKVNISFGD